MKTSKDLVAYAHKALKERWGYVWGTFGQVLTPKLLEQKLKQYPAEVGGYEEFIRGHWLNRPTSDCVGLIKSFLWFDGLVIRYDSATDVSANGMYERAKIKGAINTMPDKGGILVWKKGHIGVYIGGGEVIEANSTKKGVIKTPISGNGATPWTHWLECPYIDYGAAPTPKPADKPADEFEAALKVLVAKGVISSPEYWRANAVKGKMVIGEYTHHLILNMAAKLK